MKYKIINFITDVLFMTIATALISAVAIVLVEIFC